MSAMPVRCADVRDDLDAYALGALDLDDARRVDDHVAGCPGCRRLLDEASANAAALALAVPIASAHPALKARVLAMASAIEAPPPAYRRSPPRWWLAAAAVLVAALAGVSAWAAVTQRRVDRLARDNDAVRASATAQAADLATALTDVTAANARIEASVATQHAMMDVMAQPDVQRVGLQGTSGAPSASAQYMWSPARGAGVIIADALPQLAAGQAYQGWVVYETSWESAGTFSVDASGSGTLLVSGGHDDAALGSPRWYCVTIEPAGGSATHNGPMVLSSLVR